MLTTITDERPEKPVRPFGCVPAGLDYVSKMIKMMDTAEKNEWFIVDTENGMLKFTDPQFFPFIRKNMWVMHGDGVPLWWANRELYGSLVIDWQNSHVNFVGKDKGGEEHTYLVGNIYGYTLGKQE